MIRHYTLPAHTIAEVSRRSILMVVALALCFWADLAGGEQRNHPANGSNSPSRSDREEVQLACKALEHLGGLRRSLADFNKGERGTFSDIENRLTWINQNISADTSGRLKEVAPHLRWLRASGETLLAREQILRGTNAALRNSQQGSNQLISISSQILAETRAQRAPPKRVAAADNLLRMAKRIDQRVVQLSISLSHMEDASFELGGDLNGFPESARALLDGKTELHLAAERDQWTQAKLRESLAVIDSVRAGTGKFLGNLIDIVAAREAQRQMLTSASALESTLTGVCVEQR